MLTSKSSKEFIDQVSIRSSLHLLLLHLLHHLHLLHVIVVDLPILLHLHLLLLLIVVVVVVVLDLIIDLRSTSLSLRWNPYNHHPRVTTTVGLSAILCPSRQRRLQR